MSRRRASSGRHVSPFVQPKAELSALLKSVPPHERTAMALDAVDGFVLSMAEHAVTLDELLELLPAPRGEGVRRVEKLLSLGALRVHAGSSNRQPRRSPSACTSAPQRAAPATSNLPAAPERGSFGEPVTRNMPPDASSAFPPERTSQAPHVAPSAFTPERSMQVSIVPPGVRPSTPAASRFDEPATRTGRPSGRPTFQERTTVTTALPGALRAATTSNSNAPRTPSGVPSSPEWRASTPPAEGATPLLALSRALALGSGAERWASARLVAAHEEELVGHYLDALNIVRIVLAQLDDERVRAQQERLRREMLRTQVSRNRSRAVSAGRSGDWAAAAKHWQEVLEGAPDDREATFMAASCLFESGDPKNAGRFAKRAVELAPDRLEPRELLIRIFDAMGMELNAKRERAALSQLKAGKKG